MEPAEEVESPGKYLKAKRESQRISLRQVADATRIREAVLRAIEEDRYEDLPHIYVKSFLSAYAKRLGLDPTDVIMLHQKYAEKLSFSKSRV
ncbi:MAG: helix-turn-helix domain-containing protein, partial [Thermodesulfobacteriota bacterium]